MQFKGVVQTGERKKSEICSQLKRKWLRFVVYEVTRKSIEECGFFSVCNLVSIRSVNSMFHFPHNLKLVQFNSVSQT